MRSYLIIITIIVLLAGGSFWGNNYINTSTQKLVVFVESADEQIDQHDWEQAHRQLNNLQQAWNETKDVWSVLVNHQEIDTIDITIVRLSEYIQAQNAVLASGEIATLQLLFEHIADAEIFNLKNIL
ncbi:DUF4363 family protein [Desulfitobacterium sp.]|uniref:DUF4363 domain-containing protein n=1 Tax=bioreactor metagenome TaxID=1076179 RepID=A0A645F0H6_9ZZZZ|nr:DUF4363 family protein [Desulfitobacterium sp.]MEA4901093.1 DUF4363 family protein [Desulfitobacterium sp.]